MKAKPKPRPLTASQIQDRVRRRLRKYKGRNRLEQVALYLGSAQVLEAGLKQIAVRTFRVKRKAMERSTMGQVKRELEDHGCRPDFITLLGSVVTQRNDIAHSMLAEEAALRTLLGRSTGRLVWGRLERAIYEIEQLMVLFEWTEKNKAWKQPAAPAAPPAQGH